MDQKSRCPLTKVVEAILRSDFSEFEDDNENPEVATVWKDGDDLLKAPFAFSGEFFLGLRFHNPQCLRCVYQRESECRRSNSLQI